MRLIRLLLKCIFPCNSCLPKNIYNDEFIVRCVYSTMHLKKNGDIQKSFYSPQAVKVNDEMVEAGVSTVRRNYSKLNFIKHHCKCQENPDAKRSYHGMGYILASEIKKCKSGQYRAEIRSSPTKYDSIPNKYMAYKLPQHADILYGFVPQKNVPLPNDINLIIEGLLRFTTKEQDIFPASKKWRGTRIKS
jgi:hypothetical protein